MTLTHTPTITGISKRKNKKNRNKQKMQNKKKQQEMRIIVDNSTTAGNQKKHDNGIKMHAVTHQRDDFNMGFTGDMPREDKDKTPKAKKEGNSPQELLEKISNPILESRVLEVLRQGNQDNVVFWLKRKYPFLKEDDYGNLYYITENTPLLCSHCDNVGDNTDNIMATTTDVYQDEQDRYFFANYTVGKHPKQRNIGADDKIGIAICTYLLDILGTQKVSVLFTLDEETGTHGSEFFRKNHKDLLEKCTYAIIPDRRGSGDIIGSENEYCSDEFETKIRELTELFGYRPTMGVYSDCDELSHVINCVNLSCGYYNAHTKQEYAMLDEVMNCMHAIKHIVTNFNEKMPLPVKTPPLGMYSHGHYSGGYYDMVAGLTEDEIEDYIDARYSSDTILCNLETGEEIYIPAGKYMTYLA